VYGVLLAQLLEYEAPTPTHPGGRSPRPPPRSHGPAASTWPELAPDDLDRTLPHPGFGDITPGQLLSGCCAHDLQHTVQAEVALMQPFLPASGIWRGVFADQDVEARAG
jgi:hypothetical protein